MNSDRAKAYGRIVKTLEEVGPSKLLADEQELVREAADVLFFCEDLSADEAGRQALADCRALVRRLIESERWLEETARRLLTDLEQAGPLTPVAA